jgi:hypothetical protein
LDGRQVIVFMSPVRRISSLGLISLGWSGAKRAHASRGVMVLGLLILAAAVRADPKPGDIFREYQWRDPSGRWQRITSPDATMDGAKQFLPNAVNRIELSDLEGATRVEVQLELLQSHAGTAGQSVRVNGGDWIALPASRHIPGDAGAKPGGAELWLTMRHPAVDVPLAAFKQGGNTFEFTCRPGTGLGARWPQSIVYGVIFRVYYGAEKPAPRGRVVTATGVPGRFANLELRAEAQAGAGRTIRRVDFLAHYRGYDWRGDGVQEHWHYHTHYGELRRHAGSALLAPWKASWDVRNVPAQDTPVKVAARIEDDTGLSRISDPVALENFRGMAHTRLFAAKEVPPQWQTRAGRRNSCKITLPANISDAVEAKLILATWNGEQCDALGFNDTLLQKNIGFNHDLSYDEVTVPVSALRAGENEFHTRSATQHHGIEVLWPGAVLMVRFAPPGAAH